MDIAGYDTQTTMDGSSFWPLINSSMSEDLQANRTFLVSYFGESGGTVPEGCKGIVDDQMRECSFEWNCKCQDSRNNTYQCIRTVARADNFIHCKFQDDTKFKESYNLINDPFQLKNIADSIPPSEYNTIWRKWKFLSMCQGKNCKSI